MAKIINLNQIRKDAARRLAQARADANAVKFGRNKAEKQRDAQETARAGALLDGARRVDPESEAP